MAELTRRVQILLDEDRFVRLDARAKATGASVGGLVRDAIDAAYPRQGVTRREAVDALLAAEPMEVADWDTMKGEITEMWEKHR